MAARKWGRATVEQPSVTAVKAEAQRRILTIMPEYQQRNALAMFVETAQLYGVDPAGWPPERQAANSAALSKWAAIKAVRMSSDKIETMDPIPTDFRDDSHWGSVDLPGSGFGGVASLSSSKAAARKAM